MDDGEPDVDTVLWALLESSLTVGAHTRNGATLSPDQCQRLLGFINQHRDRRARPDPKAQDRAILATVYSLLLETDGGLPTEAAVNAAGGRFGLSRSAVYAARKQWRSAIEETLGRMSPDLRQRDLASFSDKTTLFECLSSLSGK